MYTSSSLSYHLRKIRNKLLLVGPFIMPESNFRAKYIFNNDVNVLDFDFSNKNTF